MRVAWRFAFALMALFAISLAAPSEYLAHPNGTAVIDEAGILRPAARDSLNEILTTFDKNSTNQIMLVSLKSLGGYSIEEIGVEQARALGIGQKGRDNGVLLLVALCEQGSGMVLRRLDKAICDIVTFTRTQACRDAVDDE